MILGDEFLSNHDREEREALPHLESIHLGIPFHAPNPSSERPRLTHADALHPPAERLMAKAGRRLADQRKKRSLFRRSIGPKVPPAAAEGENKRDGSGAPTRPGDSRPICCARLLLGSLASSGLTQAPGPC